VALNHIMHDHGLGICQATYKVVTVSGAETICDDLATTPIGKEDAWGQAAAQLGVIARHA